MVNFKLNKKYDSIICLSSTLISVPDFNSIKKTLQSMRNHLNPKGILLLDLPNHKKEIKEQNKAKEEVSYKMPKGRLDSIFFSYKKGNQWVEEWYGEAREHNKTSRFKCVWKEFIYSQNKLEFYLEKIGFKIVSIYGSMAGSKFDKNESYRRVYLCQKNKLQEEE